MIFFYVENVFHFLGSLDVREFWTVSQINVKLLRVLSGLHCEQYFERWLWFLSILGLLKADSTGVAFEVQLEWQVEFKIPFFVSLSFEIPSLLSEFLDSQIHFTDSPGQRGLDFAVHGL